MRAPTPKAVLTDLYWLAVYFGGIAIFFGIFALIRWLLT